jgi:hypothetical protein
MIRIWKNRPQNAYDHCCNTPNHYSQTFEPA